MSDSDNAKQSADQAWQALLRQLREQPVAPPRPFFYTRLQARLAGAPAPRAAAWSEWRQRPAYAAIIGLLMVVLHADSVAGHPGTGLAGRGQTCELRPCPSGR